MDKQGVFDILLNYELTAFVRRLFLVIWDHERMMYGLLFYDILGLLVLFGVDDLEVRDLNFDI